MGEGLLPGIMSKLSKSKAGKAKSEDEPDKPRAFAGYGPQQGMARTALHGLHVPGFKHGGKVKKTGIYKLHKGEKVMTAKQSKSHPCLDC